MNSNSKAASLAFQLKVQNTSTKTSKQFQNGPWTRANSHTVSPSQPANSNHESALHSRPATAKHHNRETIHKKQVADEHLIHNINLTPIHSPTITDDYEYSVLLYFLELNDTLKAGQRVFDIYLNSEIKKEGFDVLEGGSKYNYTVLNISANGSLNITLVKAFGSNFGPLLNAYEILQARPWIDETDQTNLEVIQKMRKELLLQNQDNEALESWSGDPCMLFPWKGVACDVSNGSSVITKLDLSSSNLKGTIPSSVTEMTKLQILNLSHCSKNKVISKAVKVQKITQKRIKMKPKQESVGSHYRFQIEYQIRQTKIGTP